MGDWDGWLDASALLRPALYVLRHRGTVVFAGKASVPLVKLWAHRDLVKRSAPSWLPIRGITYDEVLIRPAHPDRVDAELAALIAFHAPRYNTPAYIPPSNTVPLRRRI